MEVLGVFYVSLRLTGFYSGEIAINILRENVNGLKIEIKKDRINRPWGYEIE